MLKTIASVVSAVGVLAGAIYLVLEAPTWVPGLEAPKERVLVFVVGRPDGVDLVRDAVAPERIVVSTKEAIALVEGRIVAANTEAVGVAYTEAGWTERELEFFHLEKNDGLARRDAPDASGEVDPERLAKLRALVHKPTLSYGEQIFVLQAMNDGIAF